MIRFRKGFPNSSSTFAGPLVLKAVVLSFPDYVFSLEASDDFLTERVRDLPQGGAEEAQLEQDELLSRLSRYRRLQEAEETVLDFFDFREIHSEHIGTFSRTPSASLCQW